MLLCVVLSLIAVWAVNRWSYDVEWSRAGFGYNDSQTKISEIYESLIAESSNKGLEIIERPDWASKYDWKSGKTTWFKMENEQDCVVLCINDFGGYLEALIIGNARCLPWENASIDQPPTDELVRLVREWWDPIEAELEVEKNAG